MSRHYSNRYSNYGEEYDADYDDPRDHRDRYHLPDPRETPRYKTDAYYDDPRDHHSNQHSKYIEDYDRWNIDSRDLNKWVPTDPWNHASRNSGATYPHEGLARTGLRQKLGEGSEPFGRRGKKPAMKQRRDPSLAYILFKRTSLHGGKPGLARTSFHNQDTKGLTTNRRKLGGVGQLSPRHVRQSVSVSKNSPDR